MGNLILEQKPSITMKNNSELLTVLGLSPIIN